MIQLHEQGMTQGAIAQQIGISLNTVRRWLVNGCPETARGPYVSRLDPYVPYLFQRWESGCHNMAALFRELVDRGYKGSYESVRDHLVRQLRQSQPDLRISKRCSGYRKRQSSSGGRAYASPEQWLGRGQGEQAQAY